MRVLTWTGRSNIRRVGIADGLGAELCFERGVPLEVDDDDAELILELPATFPNFAEHNPPGDDDGRQAD